MIKTVASVKQEIDSLKKEREAIYSKELFNIDQMIVSKLDWIKANCNHQEDNLVIAETYEEDEYGKHCPSWDKYVITCSVCGKSVTVNKTKVMLSKYGTYTQIINLPTSELEELQ